MFKNENKNKGHGSHWGFVSRGRLPPSRIIPHSWVTVAWRVTALTLFVSRNYLQLCTWFAFFFNLNAWGLKPQYQNPQGKPLLEFPISISNPLSPNLFQGREKTQFLWGPSLKFTFCSLRGDWGNPRESDWRIWVVSGCGLRAFVPLNTNAWKQARSWPEYPALDFDLGLLCPLMSVYWSQPWDN